MVVRVGPKWTALTVGAMMIASGLAVAGIAGASVSPPASGAVTVTAVETSSAASNLSATPSTTVVAPTTSSIAAPPEPLDESSPSAAAAVTAASSDRAAATVASIESKGISPRYAYLPDYAGLGATAAGADHVSLTYTTSPAPYGIGDFGLENVSGTVVPYVTDTTSLAARFNSTYLEGYTPDLSSPDEYGVQLNAVLTNVTLLGDTGYEFWTQNVLDYTPSNQSLLFVSNIWNFSSTAGAISCNVFYAAGGILDCPSFYYSESREIPATYPYSVELWLNSTLNQGRNEVFFNYSVSSGAGTFGGSYDYAIFNSLRTGETPSATPAAEYQANGYHTSGLGLPMDFELDLGGPGGGSNFDVLDSDATYMTLGYLNATSGSYQSVDSAYNVGGESGETSVGVLADWSSYGGCPYCVLLTNGPSFSYGLWNASGSAAPLGTFSDSPRAKIYSKPMTAFVFLAPGAGVTNLSRFQWAPEYFDPAAGIVLPEGEYTVDVLAAEYDPISYSIDITDTCVGAGCESYVAMTLDPTVGVYTPLWALNESAVPSISSGVDAYGNDLLWNNQYAEIGETPSFSDYGLAYFPWFGAFNDYMFPVFAGIFLYDTEGVDIASPPSFLTYFPTGSSYQFIVDLIGAPESNDLQVYVDDSSHVNLLGGTVGGWFPYISYFGPAQSIASVTYWNVSESEIENVAFQTGGEALFLYGGHNNTIEGNTFTTVIPTSPNPYVTVAAYWGSIGLVDTDWGDAALFGADAWSTCAVCDRVINNLFDTDITATQTYLDPYTGDHPNQFPGGFSQAYNGPHEAGTNILGGDELGGNYWWDYGLGWNPYMVIPYAGINPLPYLENVSDTYAYICETIESLCDYGGGDYYPLTVSPVYTATFEEVGLPSGTEWGVGTNVDSSANLLLDLEAGIVYNYTFAPAAVTLADPAGTYEYLPYSGNPSYVARSGTFTVVASDLTVVVDFGPAYTLTLTESGLPTGTEWSVTVTGEGLEGSATLDSTSITVVGLLAGVYNWTASTTAPYSALPSEVEVTVSGDTVDSVTFVADYSLTVSESGLPAGTPWYLAYSSSDGGGSGFVEGTGTSITVGSLPGVEYNWSVAASGYVATPASGALTLSSDTTVPVDFAANDATGTLAGTIAPSSGSLYIDGTPVTTASGGTFSVSLLAGTHSVEVTSSGYATYFNNVSVTAGETTLLAITLTATSTAASGVGTLGWLLIAVLAIVVVVLLVTTLVFARRGRPPPPPVATYVPPSGATSPGTAPTWQEPPGAPPSG